MEFAIFPLRFIINILFFKDRHVHAVLPLSLWKWRHFLGCLCNYLSCFNHCKNLPLVNYITFFLTWMGIFYFSAFFVLLWISLWFRVNICTRGKTQPSLYNNAPLPFLTYTLYSQKFQVLEMESSLRARQDSVQKEMANMSTRLKKAREETNQEVHCIESKCWCKLRHN